MFMVSYSIPPATPAARGKWGVIESFSAEVRPIDGKMALVARDVHGSEIIIPDMDEGEVWVMEATTGKTMSHWPPRQSTRPTE